LKELLLAIRSITDEVYIFHHDSSPAHHTYQTVELLCREKPKFTAFNMWPPNSPDIKPVDYGILRSDAGTSLPHASDVDTARTIKTKAKSKAMASYPQGQGQNTTNKAY